MGRGINIVRRSVLEQIFKEMMNIRQRLDDIESAVAGWSPQPLDIEGTELLALPDHLRKSYLIVVSRGECNATIVSNLTGRCRAMESNYLNQLCRMGWLSKRRIAKTIHFHPLSEKLLEKTSTRETSTRQLKNELKARNS